MSPDTLLGFRYRFIPAPAAQPRTLLLLHGTGGDENDLLDIGRAVAPTAALLSPRGNVLEHGMPRFFRRLAEGVFDQQDLLHRAAELSDFVEAACKTHHLDRQQVVALGFSNGANIAAAMLLLRPPVLQAAILIRAMVPFEPAQPPTLNHKLILMLSGEADPIVPRTQAERLAQIFTAAGAAVTLRWLRAGHALTGDDIAIATESLKALPAPPPAASNQSPK